MRCNEARGDREGETRLITRLTEAGRIVHGLALFSHSAEMEGEGRVGGNRPRALGVVARPRSRHVCGLCAHLSTGTAEDGLQCVDSKRHCSRAGPPIEGRPPGDPCVRETVIGHPLECRGGQERAPLVGRLALPRVMCVCVQLSHFGRSVRGEDVRAGEGAVWGGEGSE